MEVQNALECMVKNSAVSLGKFDGIHRGHRMLLQKVLEQTENVPTVFTFGAYAGNGIMSNEQIYSQKEKELILSDMGIAREIIFPFNEETKNMEAEDFIREILVKRVDAKYICIGEDNRFGKDRKGNVQMLKAYAKEYGYQVEVCPKLICEEEKISSTRIRWELSTGKLDMVNNLLGDPYFVYGTVVHGNALGRTMGMPTANIIPDGNKILPVYGVYATKVEVDGEIYAGVTNIGLKPTVGAEKASVETTLLNFSGDLYGKEMKVSFYEFLRREKKFSGLEQLKLQMEKDKKTAAAIFQPLL